MSSSDHSKVLSSNSQSNCLYSLEYQSLYWGSAVVTNVFTYELVFVVARGLSLFMQLLYLPTYNNIIISLYKLDKFDYESLSALSTKEFVVYVIFFVGEVDKSKVSQFLTGHH